MPAVHADADAFARLLANLLPSGDAWPEEPDSVQAQAIRALAQTFAALNERGNALIADAFPGTTVELLPEWERSLGLPDECSPLEPTVLMRQRAVVAKLLARGGASIPAITAYARAATGDVIAIEQFAPFRADASLADDAADEVEWANAWMVSLPGEVTEFPFLADSSYADEPLDVFQQGVTECRLRQVAPAHTRMLFRYGASDEDALLGFDDAQTLLGQDQQVLTSK